MTNKQVKMEQQTEEPRVCQEPDVLKTLRPDPPESPPPNCAICLGTCTNKCFTDCCLHQFCFSCLLEWSKIKAECPLCKQPFKSIIYNIKSNLEYEEHIITNPERENQEDLLTLSDPSEYLFLPNGPRPQRHFQYRTTFTLEPGGEFAIQQLLLSHPRTNSISFPSDRYPYLRFNSSTHSVDQRRNIYVENWWVDPQADVTGRFRDCSPNFFRENPAQAHRIIPWLNRELTSLINHTLIYPVQQEILDLLCHYPIRSAQFRSNILHHLGAQTDHFIHEFYNFVRSPYDMIGYDRHSTYRRNNRVLPIYDLSDEDSDVHVVDSPENDDCVFVPNRTPEVIVIDSESSGNDSDVIMRTPTPPPIVDLVNDSSSDEETVEVPTSQSQQDEQSPQQEHQESNVENDRTETRSPQLPIKIRLKRSKSSAEICNYYKHKEKRRLKRSHSSSSTSSDNSSSTESYNSSSKSSSDYYKYVKKKSKLSNRKHSKNDSKYLSKSSKYRYKKVKSDYNTKAKKSKRNSKKSKKQKKSKRKDSEKRHKNIKIEKSDSSFSSFSSSEVANSTSDDDDNYHRRKKPKLFYEIKTEGSNSSHASEPQRSQSQTSQYEPEETRETSVSTATSSPNSTTSPSTVETEPSLPAPNSQSPAVTAAAAAAATTFSTNNVETNSDHWSTTSIASSCPSNNVPQDLSVAGPSNGVTVQSMVVVKDKDGSLWCRGNYQPSKRYRLYRPDLNRSSDNSTDSD